MLMAGVMSDGILRRVKLSKYRRGNLTAARSLDGLIERDLLDA
jgi:hypothetical protein